MKRRKIEILTPLQEYIPPFESVIWYNTAIVRSRENQRKDGFSIAFGITESSQNETRKLWFWAHQMHVHTCRANKIVRNNTVWVKEPMNNNRIFPLNSCRHENNHWHQLAWRIPKMPKSIGKSLIPIAKCRKWTRNKITKCPKKCKNIFFRWHDILLKRTKHHTKPKNIWMIKDSFTKNLKEQ
jgi:hypothetical protein